jgi:hypothetical protein
LGLVVGGTVVVGAAVVGAAVVGAAVVGAAVVGAAVEGVEVAGDCPAARGLPVPPQAASASTAASPNAAMPRLPRARRVTAAPPARWTVPSQEYTNHHPRRIGRVTVLRRTRWRPSPGAWEDGGMTAEPAADDRAAIVRTALDYFEGWFDGDAGRVERALHPQLAKRSLGQVSSDPERLETITAPQMVEAAANGEGRRQDPGDRRIQVDVEQVYGTIANATVRSAVYVEYLQLVRTGDGWRIVNALWQRA